MPGAESGSNTNMFYSYNYANIHFVSISTETGKFSFRGSSLISAIEESVSRSIHRFSRSSRALYFWWSVGLVRKRSESRQQHAQHLPVDLGRWSSSSLQLCSRWKRRWQAYQRGSEDSSCYGAFVPQVQSGSVYLRTRAFVRTDLSYLQVWGQEPKLSQRRRHRLRCDWHGRLVQIVLCPKIDWYTQIRTANFCYFRETCFNQRLLQEIRKDFPRIGPKRLNGLRLNSTKTTAMLWCQSIKSTARTSSSGTFTRPLIT